MRFKLLAMLVLVVGSAFALGGCATPAYTSGENFGRVMRTWDFEYKQMHEDILSQMQFYPPSRMTQWNLR